MELHTQSTFATENGNATIPPGLPPSVLSRIQQSFQLITPQAENFVRRFYEVLLEKFPHLRQVFPLETLSLHISAVKPPMWPGHLPTFT